MVGEDATRILDFWAAIDRVDPLPDHWEQTARVCELLERLASLQIASSGGEVDDLLTYKDFMPGRWLRPPKRTHTQSREEQCAALDKGKPRG